MMAGKLVLVVMATAAALAVVAGGAQGEVSSAPSTLVVGKQSESCPSPGYLRIRDAMVAMSQAVPISGSSISSACLERKIGERSG